MRFAINHITAPKLSSSSSSQPPANSVSLKSKSATTCPISSERLTLLR